MVIFVDREMIFCLYSYYMVNISCLESWALQKLFQLHPFLGGRWYNTGRRHKK